MPDRAWVVAGLSRLGVTAERIAELLGCSRRTVWVVKADPLTAVMVRLMTETEAFTGETRLLRSELTRMTAERDRHALSEARLREHLVRVTSPRDVAGAPLCGKGLHPMTPYNTYSRGGRVWCRECHRDRQAAHRARKKQLA